jgi:hypothetical protein
MMMREVQLTKEKFRGLYKSNFDLANYAIRLAKYQIKAGREVNIDELLDEIRKNPNRLKELELLDQEEQTENL